MLKLEVAVFALVTAAFTNIYITQPILPVLQTEFGISTVQVSLTVSLVILGIVISNLFFGYLSDRISIHPILFTGGILVAAGGFVCAATHEFHILVGARFIQGIFIPALTTSLAAWLAKNLSKDRLSVVMGTYVAATVLGGLTGRLLGGWIHPPLHWRYAFVSAALFVALASIFAMISLPRSKRSSQNIEVKHNGFLGLLTRKDLIWIYGTGASGLMIFSPVFNYLPYRLSVPPFSFSTEMITLVYLVYILGIVLGPVAGKISVRFGAGNTMILGCLALGVSFGLLLVPSVWAVILGLLSLCAGFFTIHATAVGLLNQKLTHSQGQANALYVLFYYIGGWLGITLSGFAFEYMGWPGVVGTVAGMLAVPLITGIRERSL